MASLIFERISSSSSSSSYSFSTHGRKYDVFLSFSGEEPRHGFTDHLYEELRRKRIHVFRDDEKLQRGEVVALELMKAIEESQYAIVVLSEGFADSKRCLDELAKIVECREKTGLSIFPVFDHVDPSDVHNQKGPFETVFAKHETDDSVTIEKKQKWMDALRDVSNISGWCLHDRSESTVIQNIVERMHSELYGEFESVSKDLVGMESSIEGVIDLLDKGSDDVRFIGIWGCGGVGKTTLAQVIYCKISNQFDTKSFICFGSVGQAKNDYLVPIQKLLSNIFAKRELNITSVHEGKKVIKQMLCSRKVLIVLDNVNDKDQLDAIVESRDWFGAGSRLIITSRDKQLLTSYNVDMYEAKTLDNDKALELFSRKAFKQPHPKKDFVDLSNDFVKYAQGLPLFLEVFGSSLHKEGIEVWKIFLDQLNENSSGEIMERLEISYKRILDQKAKELFLDIAFFFKGMDKNRVANILNDPSYWENIDILKKKSLITILGRKIWMHDLLQEMGREIVRREAPQEPGIRSRLWHHKDIFSILKNNTGTERVEGMMLNCPPNKEDLNANCFSEMTRLRLINICNVLLPHGLNYLSNELQMMEWNDYPLKFMPRNFRPNNLVELIMHHSHIEQLPEEFTNLDQLKLMDLSYSQNLIKTPDFIGFRNLERVIFQGCTRLYKVQPSVVALRWLTLLNLKDCKHLKSLPYEIDLESLEIFILSGCSRLKKFSEIGRNMTRLSELYLDGTAIKELPPSIKHLTGLTLLNLKDCNDLLSFPSVICSLTSLEILTLSGCRGQPRKPLHLLGLSPMTSSIGVNLTFKGTILLLIMSFLVLPYNYLTIFVCATLIIWTYCFLNARYPEPEPINLLLPKSFSGLSSLKSLDLSDCNLSDGALPEDLSCLSSLRFLNLSKNNFTFLPDSISQLSKLKLLCLDNCSNLQSLPYLPSSTNFVMARGCTSLENYSKKVVVWTLGETGFTLINCLSLVEEEDKITEVSLLGSLLEVEGSKRTEVSLLDIHFQPLWQRYMEDQIRESEGFCCVLPQSEITEWFKNQDCGSYVSIPLHRYNISLRGIALCVDFEVHKNSNEVSPGQDAKFICRLYMDGAPRDPIVYTVPRDKICVGSFGIWLYISHKRIREVEQCDCIRPLIRTNSADIEIKRCGARILYESDVVGFVQHLSQNIFGSPDDLRRPSEDFKKCHSGNSQSPDDRVESSQSNSQCPEVVEGIVLDHQVTKVIEGMVLNSPLQKENLTDKAFYHVNLSDVGNQRESFEKAFLKHEEDRKVRKEQIKEWRTALKVGKIRRRHLLDSSETPSSSLSSSSSSIPGSDYDVFLSFRGEDTCHAFTDHLYEALKLKGIDAFRDSKKLSLGQVIASELIQAIEKSQHAIVVFSEKYADSRWCLDELVEIVECKKNKGLKVMPVFYEVDPSDVWKQTGPFEKAFDEHQKNDRIDREKIQKWKDAMREVGNLSGEHLLPHQSSKEKVIQNIAQWVSNSLSCKIETNELVGISSRTEDLKLLLAVESNDVRFIGIWGMGGMGKTTLAKFVHNEFSDQFEASSFIHDVRRKSENGLHGLQRTLLKKLLGVDMDIQDVDEGVFIIKKRLHCKKILLILDDVDDLKQLEKLAGGHNWFGPGSRIVITTRNKHLLVTHDVNEIYEVEALNNYEALQLFSVKALGKGHPDVDYMELSQDFVRYSHGLPLALELLGSSLLKKNKIFWKGLLDKLKKSPERGIFNVLKISYEGLEPFEKEIFLNISCFFCGNDQDSVFKILDYLELVPEDGLDILKDKALIKLQGNRLWMHGLLQEMGRDIVFQECPDIPLRRSRLWLYKDIEDVLEMNKETEEIQGIVLKLLNPKVAHWNLKSFSKMHCLKTLIIDNVNLKHDLKYLPDSLRFLDWSGYPSKCFPSSFRAKSFERLKAIKLNKSLKLIETPNFIDFPVLEELELKDCINLCALHPSIGVHEKLTLLNLKGCRNLKTLPRKLEMESLEILILSGCSKVKKISEFGENMKSVSKLYLDGTAITKLPTSIGNLTGLVLLNVKDCKNLMSLPSTFLNLNSLEKLYLSGCSKLQKIFGATESLDGLDEIETAKKLKKLFISGVKRRSTNPLDLPITFLSSLCSLSKLETPDLSFSDRIGCLPSLEELILSGKKFGYLPEIIAQLSKLLSLELKDCPSLQSLPKLSYRLESSLSLDSLQKSQYRMPVPHFSGLGNGSTVHSFEKKSPQLGLYQDFIADIYRAGRSQGKLTFGSEIPEWFELQNIGPEINIKVPSHLCDELAGIASCAVICCCQPVDIVQLDCYFICNGKIIKSYLITDLMLQDLSDQLCLAYFPSEESNWNIYVVNGFAKFGIRYRAHGSGMEVKECGIHLVYKKEVESFQENRNQIWAEREKKAIE